MDGKPYRSPNAVTNAQFDMYHVSVTDASGESKRYRWVPIPRVYRFVAELLTHQRLTIERSESSGI